MQFYIYVVQFMCGQIQQNIQGIWCEFGRVFLLTYCTFHVWSNTAKYTGHMVRIWESIFTYILYISCVYQMQQKLQATWCSDAVIFFATFFVVVCLFVCFCCFFNTVL